MKYRAKTKEAGVPRRWGVLALVCLPMLAGCGREPAWDEVFLSSPERTVYCWHTLAPQGAGELLAGLLTDDALPDDGEDAPKDVRDLLASAVPEFWDEAELAWQVDNLEVSESEGTIGAVIHAEDTDAPFEQWFSLKLAEREGTKVWLVSGLQVADGVEPSSIPAYQAAFVEHLLAASKDDEDLREDLVEELREAADESGLADDADLSLLGPETRKAVRPEPAGDGVDGTAE